MRTFDATKTTFQSACVYFDRARHVKRQKLSRGVKFDEQKDQLHSAV